MNNNLRLNNCPICKSADIARSFDFEYTKNLLYGSVDIFLVHTPELWKCNDCESLFIQNIIPEKVALELYKQSDSRGRWPAKQFTKEKQPKIIRAINSLLVPGMNVLDIGANTGEFLDYARACGCSTFAVEPSVVAQKVLAHRGHRCFPSISKITGTYDYIFAFDLIEHLYDVPGFFDACKRHLTANGRIVLLIGNTKCAAATKQREHWSYILYPEHVVVPSVKALNNINGLCVEKIIPSKNSYQPFRKYYYALRKVIDQRDFIYLLDLLNDHFLIVLRRR